MAGIGGHHLPRFRTDTWLTPPDVLAVLGRFELDPCAAPEPRPWPTADRHFVRADDGLAQPWAGRVWLNPPYGGPSVIGPWMRRMIEHGQGTVLIFARTDTVTFHETVWRAATAVLFLHGRLHFHRADGSRAPINSGGPSCLAAYGARDAAILARFGLAGALVNL